MEEDSRTGFLWQYVIACFFPSQYGELLKKKKRTFLGYLFVLVLFLVLIQYVIPVAAWDASVGGLENLFLNRLPTFSLRDGKFESESPLSFTVGGVFHVEADSSKKEFTEDDLEDEYVQEILVSRNNILIKTTGGSQSVSLSQLGSAVVTNQTLTAAIPAIYATAAAYLLLLLVITAVEYLLVALGLALICRSSVRTAEGKMLSVSEAFRIAVYAKTLFAIINSANAALGYLVSSTVMVAVTVFLTMGFIVRAEQSVLGCRKLQN